MVPTAPLPPIPLRPSAATDDLPRRRSRLQSVTARLYIEQVCDIKDIEAVDPEGRTVTDIIRDALSAYLPGEKARLKMAGHHRLEQLEAVTAVDRARAHREMGREIINKLKEEIGAIAADGWTPAGMKYVQGLVDEQRQRILKMPEGDYWRASTLRGIEEQVQTLLTPRVRTLHLIKDRYVDEDEAERLR